MNDKELADRVVALGVGIKSNRGMSEYSHDLYDFPSFPYPVCADVFVRDWRVAGALMEVKCWGVNTVRKGDEWEAHVVPIGQIKEYIARNESAPRAIIEACVEALS